MRNPLRLVMAALLVLAMAVPVSGCGQRPETLLPPEGSDGENYPRTYPSS